MGTCQGEFGACRGANVLCQMAHTDPAEAERDLAAFMAERWKGARPVAWGDNLAEAQLTSTIYEDLCGLNQDRKSTRLNSSHANISYAVFCLKKNNMTMTSHLTPLPLL